MAKTSRVVLAALLLLLVALMGTAPVWGTMSPEEDALFAPVANLWVTETVHSTDFAGRSTSLVLDSSGQPHISYHRGVPPPPAVDQLFYASYDGSNWSQSLAYVDGVGGSYGTSMALDSFGYPHVSWYHGEYGDLMYTYKDNGGWHTQVVDGAGWDLDVGRYSSIELDLSDTPHISYYDVTNGALKYAYLTGTNWVSETVDDVDDVGLWTSLVLHDTGVNVYARISYYDATNEALRSAHGPYALPFVGNCGPSNNWQCDTIDGGGGTDSVGMYTAIDLAGPGGRIISYYDATNGNLKVAKEVGSGGNCGPSTDWQCDTVDDAGTDIVGEFTSIVVAGPGKQWEHVSYYDATSGDLKYAWRDTTFGNCGPLGYTWHCVTVDSDGIVGQWTSLDMDSQDVPHISYYDATEGDLKHAWLCTTPSVSVHHSPEPVCEGSQVSFDATPSGSPSFTFNWDFGDTGSSTEEDPTHTYTEAGVYTVSVQVTNSCGLITGYDQVTVLDFPLASFEHDGHPACVDAAVTFENTTVCSSTASFEWDFGDGASSTADNPSHPYSAAGTYTVILTATSECDQDVFSDTVTVCNCEVYLPVVMKGLDMADVYEPDNTPAEARHLFLGMLQRHLINPAGDVDWARVHLEAGHTYHFETGGLGLNTDTILALYEPDGQTQVATNDDCHPEEGEIWSCLDFSPTTTGWYFLRVHDYQEGEGGRDHTYTLWGWE
jgi:PKD repeat protein